MMKITPDNVLHYLQKRGLLDEEAAIKGKCAIYPLQTRNTILKIVTPNNPVFLKQMDRESMADYMFRREANALGLLKKSEQTGSLRLQIPQLLDQDDENNILISELVPETISLHDYHMHFKTFPPGLAEEQASILGACHKVTLQEPDTMHFPRLAPWILQLHKHDAREYFKSSEGSAEVIGIIQQDELLSYELRALHDSWKTSCLIHGDVKWVNFLIHKKGTQGSQRLIDWELADIGDPLWDVAGLLNSYIVAWLFGFDNTVLQHHALPEQMQPFHYKTTRPSARAFLLNYMELSGIAEDDRPRFLVRTMKYTAARILQTSIEGINYSRKVEANNMRCVQLAHNIFKAPQRFLGELFNIQIPEYATA